MRLPGAFLAKIKVGKSSRTYKRDESVFRQGDVGKAVFFLQSGKVALTVVSARGKEALVAILGRGAFFGENCLTKKPLRTSTAQALRASTILRIDRKAMTALLHHEPEFARLFVAYLLSRTVRIEKDLISQLFNSSEKRLARVLLSLAHFGKATKPELVTPQVTQEALAVLIGTARSKVSHLMQRFRSLGFIDYESGGLRVHNRLLRVLLYD